MILPDQIPTPKIEETSMYYSFRHAFLSVGVTLLLTTTAVAQNWPSFRGPNGSGIGSGSPPVTWDVSAGKNVKWKVAVEGLAHSSPIVWGDRIYLTTAVSSAESEPTFETGWMGGSGDPAAEDAAWTWKVICLDRATGRTLWSSDAYTGVPRIKRHAKATHANSSPATDGKHVVAYFASEGLYCFDVDGKLLWKKDLGLIKTGPYNAPDLEWGAASSPIIHDGKVIVQCDANNTGFWAAFDVTDGKELLRVERGEVSAWSTPAVHVSPKRTQVVLNGYWHMGGYDLETGKVLWKLSGGGDVPVPTPQVTKDVIVLTNGHGKSPIYAIDPDAEGDVSPKDDESETDGLRWSRRGGGSYMPTPIIVGDILYVGDDNGILSAMVVRSGERKYKVRLGSGGASFSASPVAADGRIYLTNEDGDVFVVQAGDEYKLLATNQMNESCMATPAISDGDLFIRTGKHLYCVARQ